MRNEDQEINEQVSKLLGGLKRIEAPGDFDFRVKARIAAGRPVDRNVSLLPNWVRFAVPLGLLLLIGGYFGFKAIYSPDKLAVAPIAEVQKIDVAPVVQVPTSEVDEPPAKTLIAKLDAVFQSESTSAAERTFVVCINHL